MSRPRVIAFYLPQFYPTPENDEWWEPGFTEWTNVARAKPLFKGHYQPRIPRDLGFYDLRVPETREKQAQLAREAGIEGFCYWHYWFGNGKRLLADVFREVVESGKPDFPFCLCWANHSWYAKTWDPNVPDKLLMEQTYPGVEDYEAHFYEMLPAFKDKRYMRMEDGRLIFGVFEAHLIPDSQLFFNTWNRLAKENGLGGFSFFGLVQGTVRMDKVVPMGYDQIVFDAYFDSLNPYSKLWFKTIGRIENHLLHAPIKIEYDYYTKTALSLFKQYNKVIPCIDPDFDHCPRSGWKRPVFINSTPEKWGRFCENVKSYILSNPQIYDILFIKAWNEWGEGNYLEPDRKFGRAYIDAMSNVFND